jgi:two-component system KDP operon response regulator KdpE
MKPNRIKVLIIDDDTAIQRFVRGGLMAAGYTTLSAATGALGISEIRQHAPDAILLDLQLPDMDGAEVIRELRAGATFTPVIVLSSRDSEKTKVKLLDLGADDYVTKPFGMDELTARIRTALRHRLQQQGESRLFTTGDLSVDLVRRLVMLREERISLSPREYDLLRLLVQHAGKVLTHTFIQEQVWGREIGVQYVRIYIRALRQKLEPSPDMPFYIRTENGVGYRLRDAD